MKIKLEDGTIVEIDDNAANALINQTRNQVTREAETWDNSLKANAKKTFDNLDVRLQKIIRDEMKVDIGNIFPSQLADAINEATKIFESKLKTQEPTSQNPAPQNPQSKDNPQTSQPPVDWQKQIDEARRASSKEFEDYKKQQQDREKKTNINAFKQLIIAEAIQKNLRDNAKGAFESALDRYYNFDYNESTGQVTIRDKNNSVVLVEGRDATPSDIPGLVKSQEGYMFSERIPGSDNGGPGTENHNGNTQPERRDLSKVSANELIYSGIEKEIDLKDDSISF